MAPLKLGIVGTGLIAGVIGQAASSVAEVVVTAVASRRPESAQEFAAKMSIPHVFNTWQELVESPEVDAVYVATPTSVKEEVCCSAAKHGKHVLGDKPFGDLASLERVIATVRDGGVVFMDATHFSHHPRTSKVKDWIREGKIGRPTDIRTSIFFPLMHEKHTDIRFNPEKEPRGAAADVLWYSLRAIIEFLDLDPSATVKQMRGSVVRDEDTNAVIRGGGYVEFSSGQTSSFHYGYNAGVVHMELDIIGDQRMLNLNDFLLDWKNSFAFNHPDHVVGFTWRTGMAYPKEFEYIAANDSDVPQTVHLVRNFAALVSNPSSTKVQDAMDKALRTQSLLDHYW
eukprot:CAMPEP_0184681644 /NCGR_PEP_ID=MMETSP0312-20130426/4627_1 /TAXON_ID=31354 /ORGANISM="Compsopogon coeruleus, Strain SAG 36.94" /LENGTH=340 /DNA_ID=CAMNT_0027132621 /DNA_START=55 /DNA_END=1074 /DNA_ORIENTATION=+